MAYVKLGDKAVGSTVKLKVDGTAREFIIVHQGRPSTLYDTSCDGTWLLLKNMLEARQWHSSNSNNYKASDIHAYLNNEWLNKLDANIRNKVKSVKIPYVNGPGGSAVASGTSGLSCKVFLLSLCEVGFVQSDLKDLPIDGATLAYFVNGTGDEAKQKRIAYLNGSATNWWARAPVNSYTTNVWRVHPSGTFGNDRCIISHGVRPALVLPSTLLASDDGTVVTNTAPTTPASITVPSQINGGSTITISWGASTDAQSNLDGYKVERSTNGGSTWTQIYQGSARSTTNTVSFGTASVMYRVKAYDTEGLESGYKVSGQVTVINNTAPTAPGSITVPKEVNGGKTLAISWSASTDGEGNLAGYSLERQVNGGSWAAIYTGSARSYTDTITKGWKTVAYRVRAYDSINAYSGFTTSETRTVNNNTPPVITCEYPSNTLLGVKNEGFSVGYSVKDEEGDKVTAAEAVDGVALRTFTVELGAANSFQIAGADFMKLLNGSHTMSITANDGTVSAAHSLTFTKEVTSASVTLEQPMEADGAISVCVLSVSGFIPADADFRVEVTSNALDDEPVWEDCTTAVRVGANHVFENKAAVNGFAFNFRLAVSRGESGIGGYITSVQGGFQ